MGPSFACNTLADLEIKQKSIISAAKIKSILIYVWRVIVASEKFRLYVVFKAHSDYGICLVKILGALNARGTKPVPCGPIG